MPATGPAGWTTTTFHADLQRAQAALVEAELTDDHAERYRLAHTAALRVAAVVLALRAHRDTRASGPRNAWRLLAQVAPEYAEWAGYFHTVWAQTLVLEQEPAVRRPSRVVSERDADDLVRDADEFLGLVQRRLDDVLRVRHG